MREGLTSSSVRVRQATAADRDAVEGLLTFANLPTEGVADQFEHGFIVAEEEDGVLTGAAGLEIYGAHGLLRSVVVHPAARGARVGERLVQELLSWALQRRLQSVYLLTTTAAPYFERFGFAVTTRDTVPASVARSSEFADVCPSTATVMSISLAPYATSGCCGSDATSSAGGCCGPAVTTVQLGQHTAATDALVSTDADEIKATVREKYGAAATRAASGATSGCCGASADEVWDPITSNLYDDAEKSGLPAEAVLASLGCGNPTALAELSEGETVLDLGSGGGIDVLLSARRVGPRGKAYGLDMTDEMLALARENQRRANAKNVEFLKGDIESIPLPDNAVDVIISNCVINLAADKSKVLREAFRVLRPGGRFAVSDVVARRPVPPLLRRSMELWIGCIAGALEEQQYARMLADAGFVDVSLEPTRIYRAEDAQQIFNGSKGDIAQVDGAFMSAFVRARKPGLSRPPL